MIRCQLTVQFGGSVPGPRGYKKTGFTVSGKIKRNDWGLFCNTAMETEGLLVDKEVKISCEVELLNAGKKDKIMEIEPVTDNQEML